MSRWLQANYKRKAEDSYWSHVNKALNEIQQIDKELPQIDKELPYVNPERMFNGLNLCKSVLEDLETLQYSVPIDEYADEDFIKSNKEFVKNVMEKIQEEIRKRNILIDEKSDKAYDLIASGKVKPGDKNYDQVMEDVILLPENSSSLIYNGTIKPDNPYYEKILEDMLPHAAEHLIDNNIITEDNPYYEKVLKVKEQVIKANPFINRSGK